LEQTQLSLRSPYLDNDLVRTAFRAPRSAISGDDVCLRLIVDGDSALRRIRTDRGLLGDSGRWSATVRQAYLTFTVKAEYAYDYGMPQWVAGFDHWVAPIRLERFFLGRHKFYHFRVWYRDTLANYVREMLLDSRSLSRPYIHPKRMEGVVSGHLKGNRNYTSAIHTLLTLELVHRLFLEAN
jgi:asparagine synthase (glutamine-hydrolysing)